MHWNSSIRDLGPWSPDSAQTHSNLQTECQQTLLSPEQISQHHVASLQKVPPHRTIILPNGMQKTFPILLQAEEQHPSMLHQPLAPQHASSRHTYKISNGVQNTCPIMYEVQDQPTPHSQYDNVGMSASLIAIPVEQFAAHNENQNYYNQNLSPSVTQYIPLQLPALQFQNLQPHCDTHMNQCLFTEYQSQPALTMTQYHQPMTTAFSNGESRVNYSRTTSTPFPKQKIIRKKNKRIRTAFTTDQLLALEKFHSRKDYISRQDREILSQQLNIPEKAIKVWFQNRRMKIKRDIRDELEQQEQELETDIQNTPYYNMYSVSASSQDKSISPVSDMTYLEDLASNADEVGFVTLDERAVNMLLYWINERYPDLLNSWQEPVINNPVSDYDSKDLDFDLKESCSKPEQETTMKPLYESISPASSPGTSTTIEAKVEDVKILAGKSDDISEYEGKNDEWRAPKSKKELDQLFVRLFC